MKKLLLLASVIGATIGSVNAQTAANAKAAGVGANVSVRGVVVNGSELGIIRYIQDITGGLAAYGSAVTSLKLGDSVLVSGPLTEYYNLFEITPPVVNFISANATLPAPEVVTPLTFGEPHEGKLIKILNCTFSATGNFSTTATNYTVTSNSQTFAVRSNTVIAGSPIPTGPVTLIGVGSQFCGPQSSSGCTKGYQLLLRTASDIVTATATVTGINQVENYGAVSVYPNPASGEITFKLSNLEQATSIVVTDVLGKIVFTTMENITKLNISHLSTGFYNLNVTTEKRKYQAKFIVE